MRGDLWKKENDSLFPFKMEAAVYGFLAGWVPVSLIWICRSRKKRKKAKFRILSGKKTVNSLKRLYCMLHKEYKNKSRQVHDAVYQDCIVRELLETGDSRQILRFLNQRDWIKEQKDGGIHTGFLGIDLMLAYWMKEAGRRNLELQPSVDVLFCPFDDTEIAVILGNLLENAAEALCRENPEHGIQTKEDHAIRLQVYTYSDEFVLCITNSYCGRRRTFRGKYYTTKKKNRREHGIGLESVYRITEEHGGKMQITDTGTQFQVRITVPCSG